MSADPTHTTQLHETIALPFGNTGTNDLAFFSVRPGIGFEDALVHVSHLLRCAHDTAYELCDGSTRERGLVWSTLHSVEAAKGLVDALIMSVSTS